jgi:hypothetical protein
MSAFSTTAGSTLYVIPGNGSTMPHLEEAFRQALADHNAENVSKRIRAISVQELVNRPRPPQRVKGMFPAEGLAGIYGPSQSGKTFLYLDLVGAISQGLAWFGHKTQPCGIVVIVCEGEHGIADRVRAYTSLHGNVDMPIEFITASVDLLNDVVDLGLIIEEIRLASARMGQPVRIAILDTLNRAMPSGDENSSRDMSAFLVNLDGLRRAIKGLAIAIHHTGKDAARGARGHSSFFAALDAALEVSRDGDYRTFKIAKSRDGKDGEAYAFRLESVEIGRDEDNNPVYSCVVEETSGPRPAQERQAAPTSANQKLALRVIGDLYTSDRGYLCHPDAPVHLPQGKSVLRIEDVVEAMRPLMTCEKKQRNRSSRLALDGLQAKGMIQIFNELLWMV